MGRQVKPREAVEYKTTVSRLKKQFELDEGLNKTRKAALVNLSAQALEILEREVLAGEEKPKKRKK